MTGDCESGRVKILCSAPDVKCVGAFASAEEALKKIPGHKPDVVLMDIRLPGMSGIQCVAELKKVEPAIEIIMVTVYEDSDRIFKALKSCSASGYTSIKSNHPIQLPRRGARCRHRRRPHVQPYCAQSRAAFSLVEPRAARKG